MKATFLGIDLGTQSAKGVVVDIDGNVVAQASIGHKTETPKPGYFEQDADEVWWYDTLYLSKELLKQLDEQNISHSTLRGMSVSTTAPCVLPVDKQGKPLRKGILYGIDTRATKQIAQMEAMIDREEIFAISCQHLSSQSCTPKVLWIRENEPEVWAKTDKILLSSGYVVYKLTGRMTADIYNSMGYAPLFNTREKRWDSTYEKELFSLDLFPEVLWTTDIAGTISKEVSELTGLPINLPVLVGTADAAAEAISCGVSTIGDMMMMYGSSNFFIMLTSALRPVEQFWASNWLDEGSTVLSGGMATVGSLFTWLNNTFPGRSFSEWEALATTSTIGANGLVILPYFAGERTPLFDANAKGVFFGLQLTTTAGDIYQAMQEAIGFGIKHNLETLALSGEKANRIVAIGGVANSAMTMQIITDIANCPQQIPSQRIGAAYGDAFLAAYGIGAVDSMGDINRWVTIEKEYLPNPENVARYQEYYEKYRSVYESTKHLMP
ncbi:MAG: FGGY-family carbohydrate kinase [Sphaerochaetaceae bacterium]|nr:FGGY-family carbohydrate kinase [Sphaerochaetaceae bacterium]